MGALLGLVLGLGLVLIWSGASRDGRPSAQNPLSSWLIRRRQRRTDLLRQAGVEGIGPAQLMGAQLGCAVAAGLLVLVLTSSIAIAACFAGFGAVAPLSLVQRFRQRRVLLLRELWPEAVDQLSSAIRAGMSLPEGLCALGAQGPVPLRPPFQRFAAAYRVTGRFGRCLDTLKSELADPVGDRICETMRVAREVGGNDLGSVLRSLSELLRSDARTRAELETRQSWVVNAARLSAAAPWIVLLLLGTQPAALRAYDSAQGVLLLIVGAVVCAVAYRLMLRIGRLPDEPRVLR